MSRCYLLMDTYTHVYPDLYTHIWKSCKICLLFIIAQPEWAKKGAYFGRDAWSVLRSSHACLNLPSDTASGSCQHMPHCLRSHYTVSHFCWDVLWLHADDIWNCASFSLIAVLTMKSIWLANCTTIQRGDIVHFIPSCFSKTILAIFHTEMCIISLKNVLHCNQPTHQQYKKWF